MLTHAKALWMICLFSATAFQVLLAQAMQNKPLVPGILDYGATHYDYNVMGAMVIAFVLIAVGFAFEASSAAAMFALAIFCLAVGHLNPAYRAPDEGLLTGIELPLTLLASAIMGFCNLLRAEPNRR